MFEQRTILVVDDDNGLRELIRINLEHEGYRVIQANNGIQGVQMVREYRPDMVSMDVMMPEMDGLEACCKIREFSQVPILLLTAKVQSDDVITGLDHGADDYLLKPFNMEELSARIRALLRRAPPAYRPLSTEEIAIDQQKYEVRVRGRSVYFTPTEYHLLLILVENAGKVVAHETLLRAVWGQEYTRDNDYLKNYIGKLRRKIELDPSNPELLLTEWGIGYRLVPGSSPPSTYSLSQNSFLSEGRHDQYALEAQFYSFIQQAVENSETTLLTVSVLGESQAKRVVAESGALVIPYAQRLICIDNSSTDLAAIVPTDLIEISIQHMINIFYGHPLLGDRAGVLLSLGYASGPAATADELIEQAASNLLHRLHSQFDDTVMLDPPILFLQPGRTELSIKHRNISATYNSLLQSVDRSSEIRKEIDFLTAVVRHDLRSSTAAVHDITKQVLALVQAQEESSYMLADTARWLQRQVLLSMAWQYSLARLGNALPLPVTTFTLLSWLEIHLRMLNQQLLLGMVIEICAMPEVEQIQITLEEPIFLAAWLHLLMGLHAHGARKLRCLIVGSNCDDFEIWIEHDSLLSEEIQYIRSAQSLEIARTHQKYIHFILASHLLRMLLMSWDHEFKQNGGKFVWVLSTISFEGRHVKKLAELAREIEDMQKYIALHADIGKQKPTSQSQKVYPVLENLLRPYIEGVENTFSELIRRSSMFRITNKETLPLGYEDLSNVLAPRLIRLSTYSRLLARNLAFAVQGIRLHPEIVNVNQEIRLACDMLEHKVSNIKIELALSNVDLYIRIASIEIEQVFVNLIKNASEALESISGQDREVHITTLQVNGRVVVRIEDTGPGIAPKNKKKIFQLNFTTKSGGRNSGIGLHAVQTIVRDAGGIIHVASTVETQNGRLQSWSSESSLKRTTPSRTGTVFQIDLPMIEAD